MSAELSSFVYKILCEHQGSLNFTQLQALVRPSYTVAGEMLWDVLGDRSKFVVVQGKEEKLSGSFLGPDSFLIAKTSLRLCQKLPESCNHCDYLHLCRYFVRGNCRYRENCKNPHELNSAHNMAVLTRVGLQNLQVAGLCWLLLQNDPYLLPEVCTHYNKGNGEHGSCKFKTACTAIHVCQHFLQGDCKFNAKCKRTHTFDQTAMKILKGKGFNQERIDKLSTIYKNKFLITSYRETSDEAPVQQLSRKLAAISISEEGSNEICLYFIRKHCSFREKCVRVHYHLPYKWQVFDRDEKTWSDLPNIEEVEMAYCNPTNSMSQGRTPINFVTMTSGSTPVRRLSTASSVTKSPYLILTTQWLWYWKDDQGKWVEYGREVDGKDVTSITSQSLENVYLSDKDTNISFTIGKHDYTLCFKEMFQQNIIYKTKREIRRRPRFISAQEVQKKLQSGGPEASGSPSVCVPPNWDQGALPDFSYKLVLLQNTCTEFKQMESLFKRTMLNSSIHSIHRIQNPSMWRVFQWQKEQMQKRSGENTVDERFLFHGTEPSLIEAICEQNFDWRICGAHGTMFGKGSYFARDAIYSDRYSRVKKGGTKIMFVALVLVGKFTRGHSEYVRPPQKGTNAGFYDSCVDNEANPSIFVIFEKYQIYPQFIIEYK